MANALILGVGILLATLFVGIFPVVLVLGFYFLLNSVEITMLVGFLILSVLVLYSALVLFRRSSMKALIDLLTFGLVIMAWVVSKFAVAIRRLGSIISFMSWVRGMLGVYPGKEFIKDRREDFVQRGIKYHERGDIEIEDSPETLARETREFYDDAGRRLSNGEAILGLTLAGVTLLPSSSPLIPYSELLSSPMVGAGLSVALVFVVSLRLSALDMVLVRDPSTSERIARLAVYRDWNQAMSSGTEVVKSLLMFRVMHGISDSAYDFYIDWAFERNINGRGVGTIELILELRRPLFAYQLAEREDLSPIEASQKLYGRNVFAQFDFGPSGDENSHEERKTNLLDSALLLLLDFKYGIRQTNRVATVYRLAGKKDMSPEEVSRELYDENILPETLEDTEEPKKGEEADD